MVSRYAIKWLVINAAVLLTSRSDEKFWATFDKNIHKTTSEVGGGIRYTQPPTENNIGGGFRYTKPPTQNNIGHRKYNLYFIEIVC